MFYVGLLKHIVVRGSRPRVRISVQGYAFCADFRTKGSHVVARASYAGRGADVLNHIQFTNDLRFRDPRTDVKHVRP